MLKKNWDLFVDNSYTILVIGMACILFGAFLLLQGRNSGSGLDAYTWPVVIVGICIYLVGRIGAHAKNKRPRKRPPISEEDEISLEDIEKEDS